MQLPGWNSVETTSRLHDFFEIAGIVILLLLVFAEVLTYVYGHRHSTLTEIFDKETKDRHDNEIAKLNAIAATANENSVSLQAQIEQDRKVVASLNERTETAKLEAVKANLELEKMKAPRALDNNARIAISNALNSFPGQAYDLVVPKMMEHGSTLPAQLIGALQQAGWKLQSSRIESRRKIETLEALASAGRMSDSGIRQDHFKMPDYEIGIDDGWVGITVGFEIGDITAIHSIEPHNALVQALRKAGIDALMEEVSPDLKTRVVRNPGIESNHMKEGPSTVHIYIGRRN